MLGEQVQLELQLRTRPQVPAPDFALYGFAGQSNADLRVLPKPEWAAGAVLPGLNGLRLLMVRRIAGETDS